MKLIDLDKAIESMAKLEQEDNEAYGVSIPECFDSSRAIEALNNMPTVQAVPIDVLDKIRAEIEKAIWEDVVVTLDGTDETRIPRLDPDEVLEIIDKYKAESEETETWNGIHAQITAPKGTFDKLWEDAKAESEDKR